MPTGMFTSKTQRQLQWSVMKPPVVGPMIELRPNTAPNRPARRPRCSGGKRSPITVKTVAKSTPPKTPWMPRKTISCVMSWERPHSADARTNPTMPRSRNGLRPKRSPSLPAMGVMVVEVTRYAVVTHARRSRPLRSATMRGIAVPTIVWSSAASSSASIVPAVARMILPLDRP